MKKSISKTVSDTSVQFDFNGEKLLECKLSELSDEIINRLALHGLSQKVGDSYASHEGMSDAHAKASGVFESLKAGQWNAGRTGNGGDLVEAIMELTGKSRDDAATLLADMDSDKRKELRKDKRVAAILARMKADRAAQRAALADDAPLEDLF